MARVVPVVATEKTKNADEALPVIDLEDFEEDRRDSDWQEFLAEARRQRQQLRLEGRIK